MMKDYKVTIIDSKRVKHSEIIQADSFPFVNINSYMMSNGVAGRVITVEHITKDIQCLKY